LTDVKLLLFDIDGTMILTHGIGRRSVELALSEVANRPIDSTPVSFSGKTDPQILQEVYQANGLDGASQNGLLDAALDRYSYYLKRHLRPERVEVLPGFPDLLDTLAERDDVVLGLLTGNLEPLAYLKLEAVGLADYFPFGAFGSDNADRYKLPAVAAERAKEHAGHDFRGTDVVIIGDTEHDIGCGRGAGAYCVAVCTGRFDRACLSAHGADVLFDDLSDTESFLQVVLGN
jgi:phosphoglycolate phosphatase